MTIFSNPTKVGVNLSHLLKVVVAITFGLLGGLVVTAESQERISVSVDPRMELLAVVQYLGGYTAYPYLINHDDLGYKRDIDKYFSSFRKNRAVKLFSKMSRQGFNHHIPPAAMLHLSNPPELSIELPYTEEIIYRSGGEKQLISFIKALRDFGVKSKFMRFYEAQDNYFPIFMHKIKEDVPGIIVSLENYYGLKQNSYNIILSPLYNGGFGVNIKRTANALDIYSIIGPQRTENDIPNFGDKKSFESLIWHEFGHSFVNPLTEKYWKIISQYDTLYKPIEMRMEKQAYGNWESCVNEHIIRAITARLVLHAYGTDAYNRMLKVERSKGFFYIGYICKELEQYEGNRKLYTTLDEFYPRLIDIFRVLKEKDLGPDFYFEPFSGMISAIRDKIFTDQETIIFILPTNENDIKAQESIEGYVRKWKSVISPHSKIISDREALTVDLAKYNLIIFGTREGNLWLKEYGSTMPFKVKPGSIDADTVYKGDHLRFITAWPNPNNPEYGILVYTASITEDIPGILDVDHGPTDFVVSDGTKVLKASDYRKEKTGWVFK